jgi:hypothetical protein
VAEQIIEGAAGIELEVAALGIDTAMPWWWEYNR